MKAKISAMFSFFVEIFAFAGFVFCLKERQRESGAAPSFLRQNPESGNKKVMTSAVFLW